jgi:hypothetical protein
MGQAKVTKTQSAKTVIPIFFLRICILQQKRIFNVDVDYLELRFQPDR